MSDHELVRDVVNNFSAVEFPTCVPDPTTGIKFAFDHGDDLKTATESGRPLGFESAGTRSASVIWLDSQDRKWSMDLATVPGLTYLGNDAANNQPIVAFHYFKQESGEESHARIVRLTGIAYGVHDGHQGVSEKGIPAEKPGWYIKADQVGVCEPGSEISWQEPAEKVFPFARIVDGPLGDPRQAAIRAEFGLY
jgi:hypothetical protein